MKYTYYISLIFSILISLSSKAQSSPEDLVFQIDVQANPVTNSITLNWNTLPAVNTYRVMRKKQADANFTLLTTNLYSQNSFVDNTVTAGESYEYAVYAGNSNSKSGYVLAGMNIAAKHNAGNIMLVIDSTYMNVAYNEIELFKRDLIKEGWRVYIDYAGRGEDPTAVKQRIVSCNTNVSLEGIVLLGHVPVPYSGNISPDAHPDHVGAWPSDIYYGDMCTLQNSIWNDAVLVNTTATSTRNHNIVGDGKFDVSSVGYSNTRKIFVGRIDVFNMSLINSDDALLFKQYIHKNHAYRAGVKKFRSQGLVDDNFGWVNGEAFAQNGWRNLSALLGPDSVHAGKFMTDLKNESYLWSYACGPGWYQGATGLGNTTKFRSNELESVFTMIYGSYFGDWDNTNNFLRGPIASPSSTLVSIWAGRPNWFLHTMALGDPIGYGMLNSIDNIGTYFPKGYANAQVHQSIQGDPSLKMYVYEAPTNLEAFAVNNNTQVKLEWTASVDPAVTGYYVYRASDIDGAFQLITANPITLNSFMDNAPIQGAVGDVAYMIRAVKNEQTVTGNFENLSPGAITEGLSSNAPLPVRVVSFSGEKNDNSNTLSWNVNEQVDIEQYIIEKSIDQVNYEIVGELNATNDKNDINYSLIDYSPNVKNYYRLKIIGTEQQVFYHNKIVFLSNQTEELFSDLLYPNPAQNNIHLDLKTEYDGQGIDVVIFDMIGRVIQSNIYQTNSAGQSTININISNLTKGSYLLRYKKEDDPNTKNLKFAKRD